MAAAWELAAARRQGEGGWAWHVNVGPVARRFYFPESDNLIGRIGFNNEMISLAEFAAGANFLRDHNLSAAGKRCCHGVSITYSSGIVKQRDRHSRMPGESR